MDEILIFDTETTIDASQRFTFGSFRYAVRYRGKLSVMAEGIIYADDLPTRDPGSYRLLWEYVRRHHANVDMMFTGPREPDWRLGLLSRSEFVEKWVWRVGYMREATIVGFNLPFDLSRLAVDVSDARGNYDGGFSFSLWDYPMRPRLRIKHIDSKKSFIEWSLSNIPEAPKFRGKFVDLRTAVFALTNSAHSLASACDAFKVVNGKYAATEHGVISDEYIDYNRNDVKATAALYDAVCVEHARHPVELPLNKLYSPASLAKAYYRAMGITPPLDKYVVSDTVMGYVMATFYGGRAECMVRRLNVPVTLVDFTSMYPTVNALMRLWGLLTAQRVDVVDASSEVRVMLDTITLEDCFDKSTWTKFVGIARIKPNGDVLPVRAKYGADNAYNIGINHLTTDTDMWYAIPDLVASKIITGKSPEILEAIRFVPTGRDRGLAPVSLRGELDIDPNGDDFFTWVIEKRNEVRKANSALGDFLKVLANSGSYGIFAEMVRGESSGDVDIYSAADKSWKTRVRNVEKPGRYSYPPIATCITAAARLMLAMLERCVTELGGSWAFCDTDSMAIVRRDPEFEHSDISGIRPSDIELIVARFDALSPYRSDAIPHLLKKEFTGWCYGISAKRYVLTDDSGTIVKYSSHGLGHLKGPQRGWESTMWERIVNGRYPVPWIDYPALSQWSVSTPSLYKTMEVWNAGKPYVDRIKPFNFISVAYVRKQHKPQLPRGVKGFQLIHPYIDKPLEAVDAVWHNKYDPDGGGYRVTTDFALFDDRVRVVTYRDVLNDYVVHPERKFSAPDGGVSGAHTVGRLRRQHLTVAGVDYIGKESNRVDESQLGLIGLEDAQLRVTSSDQRWDQLRNGVFFVLRSLTPDELGVSRMTWHRWRTGRSRPQLGVRTELIARAVDKACRDLYRSPRLIKDERTLFHEWMSQCS